MDDREYAGFYPLGVLPLLGRSRMRVRCDCGHEQDVFLWSWAGHGKARCGKCGKWWRYSGRKEALHADR